MKRRLLSLTLALVFVLSLTTGLTVSAESKTLEFDLTSNPGDWPTTNSTTPTNYNYTLNETTYVFKLRNVKCNSGYLMMTSTASLGLPAIDGYKLTKIVVSNSNGCSTSTKVGVSSSPDSASYISGGAIQTWSTTGSSYTYNLTSTDANTVYYLYVTNKNAQIITLDLTYESVSSEHLHTWGAWESNGNGTHSRTCTVDPTHIQTNDCTYGALDFSLQPTCSTEGKYTQTCSACGYTKITLAPATGIHTDGDTDGVCDICMQPFRSIVFKDQNLTNGEQYLDPFDGHFFTVTFSGGSNDGKYYDTGSGIRVYGDGMMTVTAKTGYQITGILVTYDGTNKPASNDIVESGIYDFNTGAWSGNESSVKFTRPTGSGHWRVKSVQATVKSTVKAEYSLTAGAIIGINLYFDNLPDGAKVYDGETEIAKVDNSYTIQVAAKDYAVSHTIKVKDAGSVVWVNDNVSVAGYYDNVHDNSNVGNDANTTAGDVVRAMSDYSKYAAKYFNGDNPTDLYNNIDSITDITAPSYSHVNKNSVYCDGASLILESETTLRFWFKAPGYTDAATVSVVQHGTDPVTPKQFTKSIDDDYIKVDIKLAAKELATGFDVSVTANGETATITNYAAINYVKTTIANKGQYAPSEDKKDDLVNVVKALYVYYQKASGYFG